MKRIDVLLCEARALLEPGESELLLSHVSGRTTTWLFAHGTDVAEAAWLEPFAAAVARRRAGEPVAYVTGQRGFWSLDLAVSPQTLVPRVETELLVELSLARLPQKPARILDLGTGSGAIALALAVERPDCALVATDASRTALDVARANAASHAVANVEFRLGDWYVPVAGEAFEVIASNPPYIAAGDPHLQRGDLRFEPAAALASGEDGLDAIRVIAAGAREHLQPGGWLLVEHGVDQGAAVRELFERAGLLAAATAQDLEHRDRVTFARAPCPTTQDRTLHRV